MEEKTGKNREELTIRQSNIIFLKIVIKCYLWLLDLGCNGNIKNDKIIIEGEKGTSKQCKMKKNGLGPT